jgi:AAA+ ATPase superfamily predicted ATPase
LHVREYFKNTDIETVVKIYSITGGIPMYFKLFKGENFEKELNDVVFSKTSILYEEPEFILREEVGDVHRYYLILEALAKGYNRVSEISNATGIEAKDLPKYLRVLMSLDLVEREIPITESLKSKKGRYKIKDNFFRFWFRFVYPNKSEIEIGAYEMDYLSFNKYVGEIFEDIAKEILIELNKNNKLPFKFSKIGRWWHKGEEIDLIALNENERKALFVEVKWKELRVKEVHGIFKDLERKSELTGLKDYDRYYCVFGKEIKGKIELDDKYLVFDLKNLFLKEKIKYLYFYDD